MTDSPSKRAETISSCALSAVAVAFPDDALPPSPHAELEKTAIERIFTSQVQAMLEGRPQSVSTLLACQAQLLHQLFVHSLRKCAADPARFGNVALKSQQYSRLTLEALTRFQQEGAMRPSKKSQNELLRSMPHAPLDNRRTPASGNADSWLATLEEELWKQNP